MRKLLNTLYITKEDAFLALDGENVLCKIDGEVAFRLPVLNVENIVCFSYLGCSPALMGKCVENHIPINFLTPNGRFLAKVTGETKGNVVLRVAQIDVFRQNEIELCQNCVAAKVANTILLIKRSQHDNPNLRTDEDINFVLGLLKDSIDRVYIAKSLDEILGVEGNAASCYFSIFNKLIVNDTPIFHFQHRTKRPPLDAVNAVLSFMYTIYIREYAAALEVVGLDSYIGFYHRLRSGRSSLACDLVEETRCLIERFVLTLINLKILNADDFEEQITGAVFLTDEGRKKVITKWQEKKRSTIVHPYLNQKIQFGLLPYVQANLLAKYVRGDISEYPTYIAK